MRAVNRISITVLGPTTLPGAGDVERTRGGTREGGAVQRTIPSVRFAGNSVGPPASSIVGARTRARSGGGPIRRPTTNPFLPPAAILRDFSQGHTMIRKVTRQYGREEVLALLQPLVRDWFASKFSGLTEPQAYAVPLIHERKNVLVSSPTGSGKTLTAFLTIINELYSMQLRGELEDKIYAVYISPLKALANDINRNLEQPLREMTELAAQIRGE